MTSVNIHLPTGRLVSGHPMEQEQSVDFYTKLKKVDDQGQAKMECFIQIAISKADPNLNNPHVVNGATVPGIFEQLEQIANRAMPVDPATGMKSPVNDPTGFKWKITDGDAPRQNIKTGQWVARPDYCLGMWLINIKAYGHTPTTVYQPVPGGSHQDVLDKRMIKTGDYFDVVISAEPNNATGQQAGIYVNPQLVRFNMPGEAISSNYGLNASDADSAFADRPAQAPAPTYAAPAQPPVQPVPAPTYAAPAQPPAQPVPLPASPLPPAQPVPLPAIGFPPFTGAQPPVQPVSAPTYAAPAQPVPLPAPEANYDPNFANGPGAPVVR